MGRTRSIGLIERKWLVMDKHISDKNTYPVRGPSFGLGANAPFVGRDDELNRLTAALNMVADGQGRIVFLTGQPGIGKTRLAHEALALAKIQGFTVLEGRAYPLGAGLAYAPIIEAFGPLLRSLDRARLKVLVDGLPDLSRLFTGLRLPFPPLSEGLGDHSLDKTRLFEAVMRLIERLAKQAPVALFIDDLHRADPATFELLHYLARGLFVQRVLFLATYSDSPLDANRGLRALIGPLQRDRLADEIVVPRLGQEALHKMVRSMLDGAAPADLITLLDARAGATPLFVEAFINALVESGNLYCTDRGWELNTGGATALPPNVRRLIMDRLERLAPADRRVLDLIATMGDATSHLILRAASGFEENVLLEALRNLRATGLIAESLDGSDVAYNITHPLVQEVAYGELPEMVRRRAHLAAIEALERLRPEDVNRLARHYRGAGSEANGDRALAALLAAGERAFTLYAHDEAARHYSAALAMVRDGRYSRKTAPGGDDPLLPWLLERLGEAWERIGERAAAVGLWNEALTERERAGDMVAASRVRCQLAVAEWDRGHFETAESHLQAGLTALSGQEPCQELLDLNYARFSILSRRGDVAGMKEAVAEILSVAERLASPTAEAEANLAASLFSLGQGNITAARERALRAVLVAEQAQDMVTRCKADGTLVTIGMRLGDHAFMHYHATRGLAVARRLGVPSIEVVLRSRLALANFISGAWSESLRNSQDAVALARRVGHARDLAYALAGRAMTLALQGDLAEAADCVTEARLAFGSGLPMDRFISGIVDIAETSLALERGQLERALGIARGFLAPPESQGTPSGLLPPYLPMGLMLLVEAQVAAGEAKNALKTSRSLAKLGPTGNQYISALASRSEGLAQRALGQPMVAIACLTRAHEDFAALEMPFEAARSLLELADLALHGKGGKPDLAIKSAQQSLAIFERLGAQYYAERARRLLTAMGISPQSTRRSRLGGISVSARELEIARLVAQGMTTSEIAERLTLSPLTVTAHLRRVYARLGISSRTALARCVIEAGLL
ncbi:MAG: DUF2791 family P-loop domain-containing protein [Dehalococcoidia bacterium]|nr:DUF2791 family P-loop domain-containing protein [Dehalococcoidia bacterium]